MALSGYYGQSIQSVVTIQNTWVGINKSLSLVVDNSMTDGNAFDAGDLYITHINSTPITPTKSHSMTVNDATTVVNITVKGNTVGNSRIITTVSAPWNAESIVYNNLYTITDIPDNVFIPVENGLVAYGSSSSWVDSSGTLTAGLTGATSYLGFYKKPAGVAKKTFQSRIIAGATTTSFTTQAVVQRRAGAAFTTEPDVAYNGIVYVYGTPASNAFPSGSSINTPITYEIKDTAVGGTVGMYTAYRFGSVAKAHGSINLGLCSGLIGTDFTVTNSLQTPPTWTSPHPQLRFCCHIAGHPQLFKPFNSMSDVPFGAANISIPGGQFSVVSATSNGNGSTEVTLTVLAGACSAVPAAPQYLIEHYGANVATENYLAPDGYTSTASNGGLPPSGAVCCIANNTGQRPGGLSLFVGFAQSNSILANYSGSSLFKRQTV